MGEIKKAIFIFLICYLIIILITEIIIRKPLYKYSESYIESIASIRNDNKTFLYNYIKIVDLVFGNFNTDIGAIFILFFHSIKDSFIYIFAFSISAYTNSLIKLIYNNPRPFWTKHTIQVRECSLGFGNPSGHSARSTILFLTLYYYSVNFKKLEKKKILKTILIIPFLLIIFSVMYSRVFFGKHTFNQILFGFSFGVFFYILWFYLLEIQNYTSKMFFDFVSSIYLYIFSFVILLLPFPIYFITSYFSNIKELEEKIPKYCFEKKKFTDNQKFFKTGLLSTMKTTSLIGSLIGFLFVKIIMKNYPHVDEETILEWKNNNLMIKTLRCIIIIICGAIPKIIFSKVKYKENNLIIGIIYEIIASFLNSFCIFGFGVTYSYLCFNSYINKSDIDDLDSYNQILPNETNTDTNVDENNDINLKTEMKKVNENV